MKIIKEVERLSIKPDEVLMDIEKETQLIQKHKEVMKALEYSVDFAKENNSQSIIVFLLNEDGSGKPFWSGDLNHNFLALEWFKLCLTVQLFGIPNSEFLPKSG
jgi:hypothetical protein